MQQQASVNLNQFLQKIGALAMEVDYHRMQADNAYELLKIERTKVTALEDEVARLQKQLGHDNKSVSV